MHHRHKAIQRQTTVLVILIAGLSATAFSMWDAVGFFPSYLMAINAVTLMAFAFDKAIVAREYTRIPERTLFALALLGGTPAALVAMSLFRHKISKRLFKRVVGGIIVVQTTACVVWFQWFR